MPISFMQVSDGQVIQASHLNINYGGALNGGNPILGGGLQDLVIQTITYHQHVNKDLFEAALLGTDYNLSAISSLFGTTNFTLQGTWDNFCKLTLGWISHGDILSSPNPFIPDSTKFTWYLGQDNSPNHVKYTTNLQGGYTTTFDVKYDVSGIFAHEIYPESIALTGDVGNNETFLEHIQDSSIHFRQIAPPTPTSDNDHMASHYGYLNLYDLTTGFIDLNTPLETKRATDDYFFNQFDRNENDDLERIGISNTDILHPMIYEEGVYLFINNKVRQYKIFKADPDDFDVSKSRMKALPMDSLFVGGSNMGQATVGDAITLSVAYSSVKKKYIKTLNTNLDSYWYGNNYIYGLNREWKGGIGERYIEFLMHEGLGYQPRRGMSTGV